MPPECCFSSTRRSYYCQQWFAHLKPDGFRTVLTIINESDDGTHTGVAYLSCSTHRSLVLTIRAKLFDVDLNSGTSYLELGMPLKLYESYSVVSDLYSSVEDEPYDVMIGVKWQCSWGTFPRDAELMDTGLIWGRATLSSPERIWKMDYFEDEDDHGDDGDDGDVGDGGGGGDADRGPPKKRRTEGRGRGIGRGRGRSARGKGRGGDSCGAGAGGGGGGGRGRRGRKKRTLEIDDAFVQSLDDARGDMGDNMDEIDANLEDEKHDDKRTSRNVKQHARSAGKSRVAVEPDAIAPEAHPADVQDPIHIVLRARSPFV